jgi:hypothetical protein
LIDDIHFFDKYIGTQFQEVDENGNYLGCLLPVYLLYPKAYRFKPTDNFSDLKYIYKNILDDGEKINYASNFGDVVIVKFFGHFHFFVFIEPNKYVHISPNTRLCYTSIERMKNNIIGTYRYKGV